MDTTKNILDLSNTEAKDFLLREESYSSVGLPPYFKFEPMLRKLSKNIKDKDLKNLVLEKRIRNIKGLSNVNYKLTTNKDGKLSWREFQIINPIVYIVLCNLLTDNENWTYIKNRFKKSQKFKDFIETTSIPPIPGPNQKQSAVQIKEWWTKNEKRAIDLALDYEFVAHTDISTFYDSIYTHSIPWALHGKEISKERIFGEKNKSKGGNFFGE
ncbi:MAG: hypothetical protein IKO42_05260, partial [Opitutales bacterium]|nr:hypothetical protein [Opitutales bacterium]